MRFDAAWATAVRRWCDPVFAEADCAFEWNESGFTRDDAGPVTSMLWEGSPERFVARYPDSDLAEEVGEADWPPPCIDYWVYVDAAAATAELSVEGLPDRPTPTPLTGDGEVDGRVLAARFAEILRVSPPAGPAS